MTRISAIAALGARTRALGKDGGLLWRIPEDLARLKESSRGHPIILGRATFASIGRLLPEREHIILSRDRSYTVEGTHVVDSLDKALDRARSIDAEEAFVFGGAQIYAQALPYTDRLYLTLIDDDTPGDVFFPDHREFTRELSREEREHNGLRYAFVTLERER